jgi:hypothetical protein
LETCARCVTESGHETAPYCPEHLVTCEVNGEDICYEHAHLDPIASKPVCGEHTETCALCRQPYLPTVLEGGRCQTCRSLGDTQTAVPTSVEEEFRSVKTATNDEYLIVYGKRLLGANELLVLDRESDTELDRRKIGVVQRLKGVFR